MIKVGDKVIAWHPDVCIERTTATIKPRTGAVVEVRKHFAIVKYECGRGRSYREAVNLPRIESDNWSVIH